MSVILFLLHKIHWEYFIPVETVDDVLSEALVSMPNTYAQTEQSKYNIAEKTLHINAFIIIEFVLFSLCDELTGIKILPSYCVLIHNMKGV